MCACVQGVKMKGVWWMCVWVSEGGGGRASMWPTRENEGGGGVQMGGRNGRRRRREDVVSSETHNCNKKAISIEAPMNPLRKLEETCGESVKRASDPRKELTTPLTKKKASSRRHGQDRNTEASC